MKSAGGGFAIGIGKTMMNAIEKTCLLWNLFNGPVHALSLSHLPEQQPGIFGMGGKSSFNLVAFFITGIETGVPCIIWREID